LEKGFYFFIDTLMYDTVNSHRIYSMVGSRWLKVDGLKNRWFKRRYIYIEAPLQGINSLAS
jgi:hypothetical protein